MTRAIQRSLGALLLTTLVCSSRPAQADPITILPGQQTAFVLEGVMSACSLTSIIGNTVTGVRKAPNRAFALWRLTEHPQARARCAGTGKPSFPPVN